APFTCCFPSIRCANLRTPPISRESAVMSGLASDPASQTVSERTVTDAGLERRVLWKVTLRLIPFLFVLYVVNILDLGSIGFAGLRMLDGLSLSAGIYAFGAGLFYIGYFGFEIPSNLILNRTGARVWIARIMITWGIISASMMFVRGPWSFYLLRLLLGV